MLVYIKSGAYKGHCAKVMSETIRRMPSGKIVFHTEVYNSKTDSFDQTGLISNKQVKSVNSGERIS